MGIFCCEHVARLNIMSRENVLDFGSIPTSYSDMTTLTVSRLLQNSHPYRVASIGCDIVVSRPMKDLIGLSSARPLP